MPYEIRLTRQAAKDAAPLTPKLRAKLRDILVKVIGADPYQGKKLLGDLAGSHSFRLNFKDRIVYSVDERTQTVFLERARTHCGG